MSPVVYTNLADCVSLMIPKKRGVGYLKQAIPADHNNTLAQFIANSGISGDAFGCDGPLDFYGKEEDIIPVLKDYLGSGVEFIKNDRLYWHIREGQFK